MLKNDYVQNDQSFEMVRFQSSLNSSCSADEPGLPSVRFIGKTEIGCRKMCFMSIPSDFASSEQLQTNNHLQYGQE